MTEDALTRLREICLALPEAVEQGGVTDHTFRVRKKIFAMFLDDHHGDGRVAMWCKAPAGAQEMLVGSDPTRFFVPPYVGHHGWLGVRLDGTVDWDEVADLVADAHRMTAPKRLLRQMEGADTRAH
jgi:hypothetical protein